MTATFVPPAPNCGHDGVTFTFYPLGELFLCPPCMTSIGPLHQTCSNCGAMPKPGTLLVDVFRRGRLCFTCRRDALANRPRT